MSFPGFDTNTLRTKSANQLEGAAKQTRIGAIYQLGSSESLHASGVKADGPIGHFGGGGSSTDLCAWMPTNSSLTRLRETSNNLVIKRAHCHVVGRDLGSKIPQNDTQNIAQYSPWFATVKEWSSSFWKRHHTIPSPYSTNKFNNSALTVYFDVDARRLSCVTRLIQRENHSFYGPQLADCHSSNISRL